ncbi:MAG: aminoacyl-tRNA hydrolase [Elusimicrobia bacterium]|nr:aminoacyl-tRNA hydrolase [Elusimicrobiota bacterium]MBD3412747.1 aminoacyl-tRNA hydrolase [Elusimicrobiota bacterium]
MKLIAGLGNPGTQYQNTRHNIGFDVIDYLADGKKFAQKFHHSLTTVIDRNMYAKPWTFMNASGRAVRELLAFFHIDPADLLVICDDFAIPTGNLRLRRSGSSGGHKGLQSIIETIQTSAFPRLRVGIGPIPKEVDPSLFVLQPLSRQDRDGLRRAVERASDCVRMWVDEGIEKAMNNYNA